MARVISCVLGGLLLVVGSAYGRTRDNVLTEADVYQSLNWTPTWNNLLDKEDHYAVLGTTLIPLSGEDGVDDRGFARNKETNVWEYSKSNWPFVVGSTVTGEAYGWGYAHHLTPELRNPLSTYSYKSFKEYLQEGRIAGARSGERDRAGGLIGNLGDNEDFTGVDCSGFVTRVLGIKNYHIHAAGLINYALQISTAEFRTGDLLLRYLTDSAGTPIGKHVMVVDEVYPSSVAVYHAVPKKFSNGAHVRRVSGETIQMRGDATGRVYLKDFGNGGGEYFYYPYSPFPQFRWVTPSKAAPLLDPFTQSVELEIVSKSSVAFSSVTLVFDAGLPTATTVQLGAEGYSLKPAANSARITVGYALTPDFLATAYQC